MKIKLQRVLAGRIACCMVLIILAATYFSGAVMAAPGAGLGVYAWAGEWETNWGKMVLTQNGATVTGTYTHDSGRISGSVSGNTLTGSWSEKPSYALPRDAGEIEFVMAPDGKSFTGKWRYGASGNWGDWKGGKRITPVVLAPKSGKTAGVGAAHPAKVGDSRPKPAKLVAGKPLSKSIELASSMNIAAVYNKPTAPVTFSLSRPHLITHIVTYHWNNARGAFPGTIALLDSEERLYGPWKAGTRPGQGGVPNAYWEVWPNVVLPAGTYTIIDSDPATWAQNRQSGGQGMAEVKGTPHFQLIGGR